MQADDSSPEEIKRELAEENMIQREMALEGEAGNAFWVMGAVDQWLSQMKVPKEKIDAYMKQARSGDYDNLLRVCQEACRNHGINLTYSRDGEEVEL